MLKEKAIKGAGWSAVQHIGRQGVKFVISIILARLLPPEDFGTIGVLLVFYAIGQTFIDSGLGQALIQKQDPTYIDECSMFYSNIVLAILMYIAIYFAAPFIADYYKMQEITELARVLGLALIISSISLIHSTLLTKYVEFKKQAKVTLVSVTLSGTIGIVMAYAGYGIWSLVAQLVASSVFNVVGLWVSFSWRPAWAFSFQSLRSLFGFGSKILAQRLIDTIFKNIFVLVIGKIFTAADLGYYSRANSLVQLPVQNLAVVSRRVTFPIFSSINDDPSRIARGMRQTLALLFFVNCPVVLGIASAADTLVYALLTEKWAEAIPYIRLLSVIGLLYPLHVVNLNALLAIGRSDLTLKLEIIKKILLVLAISITWRWGIEALIIGAGVQSVLAYLLNAYYTKRFFNYSYLAQITDVLPYIVLGSIMAVSVYMVGMLPVSSVVVLLFIQIFVGSALYLFLSFSLRLPACVEMMGVLRVIFDKWRKPTVTP